MRHLITTKPRRRYFKGNLERRVQYLEEHMVTQEELDGLADRINTAVGVIKDEVTALEKQIGEGKSGNELDTSKLSAAVNGLEGIEPPKGSPQTSSSQQSMDTPSSLQGAAPTKADGTAVEHTEDPAVAKARADLAAAEEAEKQRQAEDAARSNV